MRKKKRRVKGADVITEIGRTCMLMRARLISRVITAIYDEELRPLGIVSPQFALLVIISEIEPATRAEIGRYHHQDRSTLSRNLKIILSEGWAEEVQDEGGGRGRPIVLTEAGRDLIRKGAPEWRVAQARAKALLGEDGAIAITDIANSVMNA
ncbi:MAG: MarR family winged helix-turn-helix transcriptional regulator [Stellaceae bacterium]